MSNYSIIEKFLHRIYLSNFFLSKASLEVENALFSNKSSKLIIEEYIFITGLARSGTTALTNKIFNSQEYASLQYSNMPFLFLPNLWRQNKKIKSLERAHKDGILIKSDSPEEFDEYFWKAHLNNTYIQDELILHKIDDQLITKYLSYISLVCLSKNKLKYISKNNNNILRIGSLKKIKNSKIIILYREPKDHANSLLKLHNAFSNDQSDDQFVLDYFNFLGHHEFGLNHKPFLLNESLNNRMRTIDTKSINYWLLNWINYYTHILNTFDESFILISFDDLITNQENVYDYLNTKLQLRAKLKAAKKYVPTEYSKIECDQDLLKEAESIFHQLSELTEYT